MPTYTNGYVTDDGSFFEDRKEAERHETKVDLMKISDTALALAGTSTNYVEGFIDAILVKYDLSERYDYKPEPVPAELGSGGTVVDNIPEME